MSAVLKSPFDNYIVEIVRNPHYLSTENAKKLIECIRQIYPSMVSNAGGENGVSLTPQELLAKTIRSLSETIDKMQIAAVTSEDGANAADLGKIVAAQEKQIRILTKLSDTLTANDRQTALENAVVEALEETKDTGLKELFLANFRAKLGQKTHKLS